MFSWFWLHSRVLFEAGAEVDARDEAGLTALMYECWTGCARIAGLRFVEAQEGPLVPAPIFPATG